ncbi:MAG TPA: tetratricopeptide repeat protein [Candidatus Angelobacter sp.]|nr:tetratricopeptide repeat protein [Candidatus Angelobacter sp.]
MFLFNSIIQVVSYVSPALIAFNICSLAQRNPIFAPRPGQSMGQDIFNSLSGSVVSADNKPLKNVRVELRNGNGSTLNSVYTNSAGMFEFPAVQAGMYEIVATSGVEQAQERIEMDNAPSSVSLRLPVRSAATDGRGMASVSVAQYKVPEKARDAFKKAQSEIGKGQTDDAQKHLAKALEIYPNYADALALRGVLKMGANDHEGAIADLQQAITNDENCALAYLVMGAVLNMQSKFDDAIRTLQRGEALAPNSWQAYFEMGKALIGKAQYEPALRQLDRAQTLAPIDYPLIHLVRAHAMLALNNYSDAMTELQAYLAKDPQGPNSQEAQKMLNQARAFSTR